MSIEDPQVPAQDGEPSPAGPAADRPSRRALRLSIGAAALLGVLIAGAGAGAVAMSLMHPRDQQTLLPPVAVNQMADDSLVAVKGEVAEIFGNKFILSDGTGRALVDTGRGGEDKVLVKPGEEVTAQGRFDDGFVKASMVIHADGKVDELRGPPPRHDHGPKGRGPRDLDRPGAAEGPGSPDAGTPRP